VVGIRAEHSHPQRAYQSVHILTLNLGLGQPRLSKTTPIIIPSTASAKIAAHAQPKRANNCLEEGRRWYSRRLCTAIRPVIGCIIGSRACAGGPVTAVTLRLGPPSGSKEHPRPLAFTGRTR
jgi:hypothetical protein